MWLFVACRASFAQFCEAMHTVIVTERFFEEKDIIFSVTNCQQHLVCCTIIPLEICVKVNLHTESTG